MTVPDKPTYQDHQVFAATYNAPDPWPICLDCGQRVYLHPETGWEHLNDPRPASKPRLYDQDA
jgi:hypothetical protein